MDTIFFADRLVEKVEKMKANGKTVPLFFEKTVAEIKKLKTKEE